MSTSAANGVEESQDAQNIKSIWPPGTVPGRQNRKRITAFAAEVLIDVPGAYPERVITFGNIGVILLRFAGPS